MKDLSEYPTPETDETYEQRDGESRYEYETRRYETSESLERRLAACRASLDSIQTWAECALTCDLDPSIADGFRQIESEAAETLTLTLTTPKP